jgi:hypothetical protein
MNPQDADEKKSDFIETKYLESNNSEDVLSTRLVENITPQESSQVAPNPTSGNLLLNRFLVLKVLGEGAFGKVFLAKDCSIAEINPLVVTKEGCVEALDAKMVFDENALFRHPEIAALRDET